MNDSEYIKTISNFIKSMKYDDIKWMEKMINHHEMALTMAEEAIAKTERNELKLLAENIIKTQTKEINQMKAWIKEWS
ncbi:MAG: DUF305 domain-containing protein [Chitinophagaceae bacterium]|nr:DUF305 domain-containing protein [Chitinophagaceae bacterium]